MKKDLYLCLECLDEAIPNWKEELLKDIHKTSRDKTNCNEITWELLIKFNCNDDEEKSRR